jgi:membrane-associated protease RseP (regulator of RpoE activity)
MPIPPAARPRGRFPAVNVALFLATVATTVVAGAGQVPLPQAGLSVKGVVEAGLPFAASIIGILLCHEMGHYLMARAWRVDTTLPFFIPVPFGVGTLGAVIRIRSSMPSRRAVLDIGAAGPIAGFVVALPLLAWGLAYSEVKAVGEAALGSSGLGSPYELARTFLQLVERYGFWEALQRLEELGQPGTVQLMGDSLVTWAVQRLVLGPVPAGHDVFLHPVAFAAWLGLFVTTLNVIPIGQLDGGHVLYALLGQRGAHLASRAVSFGLFLCGVFLSWNWLVWWLLTRLVVGLRHPPALAEEPLRAGRKAVAVICLLLFAATFIPVPIVV